MPSYILLNSGNHIGLNAGGAVLLNTQDAEVEEDQRPTATYGGGDYEARVRAHWERIESLRAEKQAKEAQEAEREIELARAKEAAEQAQAEAKRRRRKAERLRAEAELSEAQDQVASLEGELTGLASQITDIETAMAELMALIDSERVLREQRLAFLAARRRMMLALVLASQ